MRAHLENCLQQKAPAERGPRVNNVAVELCKCEKRYRSVAWYHESTTRLFIPNRAASPIA